MMYIARNTFSAAKDVPELTGKVILVTGGNTGLGKQYILDICRHHPAQVWLASRSVDKAKAAIQDIRKEVPDAPIEVLPLDLANLSSVKTAAGIINERCSRLDLLMLNAGIMFVPAGTTADGFEIQFGTNYLGHALLTILLLPLLERTASRDDADVRIVGLTSWGHNHPAANGIEFDSLRSDGGRMWNMTRYGQSKLAAILMMRHLAKLYPSICTASVHPGMVATELGRPRADAPAKAAYHTEALRKVANLCLSRVEDGVKNQLWASVAQEVQSGEYYEPVGIPGKASALGRNDDLAKKLWDWTEDTLRPYTQKS